MVGQLPEDFFENGKLLVNKMASAVMAEFEILTFNDNEAMLIYNPENGLWEDKAEITIKNFIDNVLDDKVRRHHYEEVLFSIKAKTYFNRKQLNGNKNKIFRISYAYINS